MKIFENCFNFSELLWNLLKKSSLDKFHPNYSLLIIYCHTLHSMIVLYRARICRKTAQGNANISNNVWEKLAIVNLMLICKTDKHKNSKKLKLTRVYRIDSLYLWRTGAHTHMRRHSHTQSSKEISRVDLQHISYIE